MEFVAAQLVLLLESETSSRDASRNGKQGGPKHGTERRRGPRDGATACRIERGRVSVEIVCLDLEGVLIPEIWVEFAEAADIPELKRTTRDEPDYDKLMQFRLDAMNAHGMGIDEVRETLATIEPVPGAREFLDELRGIAQVIIVSDTFIQFAQPIMPKLGNPTIFCNDLVVDRDGKLAGYRMRCKDTKATTVKALHEMGFETIASGDSHNDIGMIENSKAGFLFRSTEEIEAAHPEIPAYEEFDDLLAAIEAAL